MMSRKAWLAWSWTVVILALCWTPRIYLGAEDRIHPPFYIPNIDKLVHLGIFAAFAWLWARVEPSRVTAGRVFAAGVALAVVTELGQETAIVNRDATWGDGVADVLGVVVGLVAHRLGTRRGTFRTPSSETP